MRKITVSAAMLSIFLFTGVAQAFTAIVKNCTGRVAQVVLIGQQYFGIIPRDYTKDFAVEVEPHSIKFVDMEGLITKKYYFSAFGCSNMGYQAQYTEDIHFKSFAIVIFNGTDGVDCNQFRMLIGTNVFAGCPKGHPKIYAR